MQKLIKPLAIIAGIFTVLFVGAVVFVHLYLTDERIKSLIVPPTEKALGRVVSIGEIKVSIFSGISIHDFVVKEPDGKRDFAKIGRFILRYDLLPLLKRQIVISQIRIADPFILLSRDRKGTFNFETLAVLAEKKPAGKPPEKSAKKGRLPLALTVQEVRVDNANIKIADAKNEIPATTVKANTRVALAIGTAGKLTYKGDVDARIVTEYGKIKPDVSLTGRFDQSNLEYSVDLVVEGQNIKLNGRVKDYAKSPDILLNITSDLLNLDKLAALADKLPQSPSSTPPKQSAMAKTRQAAGKAAQQNAPSAPPVHGTVKVKQATYDKLNIADFSFVYALKNNTLNVRDLSTAVARGKITGQANLDMNQPDLTYNGKIGAASLQLTEILNAFAPKVAKTLSGGVSTSMVFSGKGTEWQKLRDKLNADGNFTISNGRFHNTPMTSAIASLLGLKELNDLTFKESGGKFQIKNGKARLTSSISGSDLSVDGDGVIGLDGQLDFPMTLYFSPGLSAKLKKRTSFAKYLTDEKGETTLHLKVKGTIDRPRPTIDTKGLKKQAEKQLKKEVEKKALEELGRAIKKNLGKDTQTAPLEDAAKKLLEGILGK